MTELLLPPLEPGAVEAEIEHVFVQPDETIAAGQSLALVRTARFVWDVPATASGTIATIVAEPGTIVAVGSPLARLHEHSSDPAPIVESIQTACPDKMLRATPLARKIAAVHALDLATISGTGRGGVITRADLLPLITNTSPAQATTVPHEALHGNVRAAQHAAVLSRSLHAAPVDQTQPVALTAIAVDLSAVNAYVAQHTARLAKRGVVLSATNCIAYSVVALLHEFRWLNSAWRDDGVILRGRVRLGFVPNDLGAARRVIANAGDLNVQGLARALHENPAAAEPPTFTIVESGVVWSAAAPYTDHSATLIIGKSVQQPTVVSTHGVDTIVIRPTTILTLAYDARILDQPVADRFLSALKTRLERFHAL